MNITRFFLTTIAVTLFSSAINAKLWVYPTTDQTQHASDLYSAQVSQDKKVHDLLVYQTKSIWHNEFRTKWKVKTTTATNNWVSFSFTDQVEVSLSLKKGEASSVELRPNPDHISGKVEDGAVKVTIDKPGQYFVLVNDEFGIKNPFFIFANPPEKDIPQPKTEGVHYFGPGFHDIGDKYPLKENETMYIAGGAWVQGSIDYKGDNITIRGRGILSDRKAMHKRMAFTKEVAKTGDPSPWEKNNKIRYRNKISTIYGEGNNTTITGITVIDVPFFTIRAYGNKAHFENLKFLTDLYNNNGIFSDKDHKILNSFFKVDDDIFAWMSPISETRNCVIWKQPNACMVQMGYGYGYTTHDHIFKDNVIIMDQTRSQNRARALFGLASSSGTEFTKCKIENLKVYGDVLNFLAIDNWYRTTPWSASLKKPVKLREINLHFKNVEITGTERGNYWGKDFDDLKDGPMRSRLRTEKDGTIKITLENVKFNGKTLKSDADWPNGLIKEGNVAVIYR